MFYIRPTDIMEEKINETRSLVKISWRNFKKQGKPILVLAGEDGYREIELRQDQELDLEITNDRRCIGFRPEPGQKVPCPEFRSIDKGDQCGECRTETYTQTM